MTKYVMQKTIDIYYLENVIEYAWRQAMKYKYDPVASKIHEEYLNIFKKMKADQILENID